MKRFTACIITPMLAAFAVSWANDGMRPQRFGPFLQQSAIVYGSPAGYSYLFPVAAYNFQAGWMEPIAFLPWPVFRGSYLEAQGNATLTPYQSDFGIAFNLKPIRCFEFGLAYNRLLFPYTLAGFNTPAGSGPEWLPENTQWRPPKILGADNLEVAGADIFTYQANLTVKAGPLQLYGGGAYGMWAVDTRSDVVLEHRTGLLIKRHDRIGSLHAQAVFIPQTEPEFLGFSAGGVGFRNQYWWTDQSGLSQNLVSAGFTGLRRGRNGDRLYRGLDGWAGIWTSHPQLTGQGAWERLNLSLQWTWNIQVLDLVEE